MYGKKEEVDTHSLGDRIADSMRSPYRAALKYCQDKYGDEFIQDDYLGTVYSTRFPGLDIQLYWDNEAQSYRDYYLVYLRKAELSSLLIPLVEDVYGNCKVYIDAYKYCLPDTTKATTAEELLESNLGGSPMVQLTLYTVKDLSTRDDDLHKLSEELGNNQYWVAVNVLYVSTENFEQMNEAKDLYSSPRKGYKCMANVIVTPDGYEWRFSEHWREE